MDEIELADLLEDKVEISNKLGEGGWAEVYKGKILKEYLSIPKGTDIAIKTPKTLSDETAKRFKREINIYSHLKKNNSKHAINFFGFEDFGDNKILLFTELGQKNGQKFIKELRYKNELNGKMKKHLVEQVCNTYIECHNLQIEGQYVLINDGSWSNFILTSDGILKGGDFGSATPAGYKPEINRLGRSSRSTHGNVLYSAPETMGDDDSRRIYSIESDICNAGWMFFELYSGKLPFEYDETGSSITKLAHAKGDKKYIDNAVKKFLEGNADDFEIMAIRKGIDPNPENRFHSMIEFREALQRPMVRSPLEEWYDLIRNTISISSNYGINDIKESNIDYAIKTYYKMLNEEKKGNTSTLTSKAKELLVNRAKSDHAVLNQYISGIQNEFKQKKKDLPWEEYKSQVRPVLKYLAPKILVWGNEFYQEKFVEDNTRVEPANTVAVEKRIDKWLK